MGNRAALWNPMASTPVFRLAGVYAPPRCGWADPWPAPSLPGALGPSPRPAHSGHLHRGARSAAEREDGRGRGGGARARPDSSALLAHSLVPGFRAQHGGQGDSNSLLLPLLHKRHSGDPACRPSPPPISFFAWVLDSVSSGSSSRVGELCGAWTGERGCPAGGGERGGIVSWRGLWGPRLGEGRVVSCSKCIVSPELEGIGKGVGGSGM